MTLTPVRTDLHTGWTVRAAHGPAPEHIEGRVIPAAVPGCVHTDLLGASLIPDPYLDDNEALLSWVGLVDWTYETTFEWADDGHARHDLVFDGLDTVATVRLNGHVVLSTANQHRSYRADVREALVEGTNRLEVAFRSPVRYANAQSQQLAPRPRAYPTPYEAIRKSACSFGWDWGISTATSGIWRPVRLESWSVARIAEVRLAALPAETGGRLTARVLVERADAAETAPLTVDVEVAGRTSNATVAGGAADLEVEVADAELWWPIGYGEQPLYPASFTLSDDEGVRDETQRRVGFRSVRWDMEPDAEGTPFTLIVNDQPVYVKGVNWIPDDALFVRVDRARYERRLRQAAAANLNLVRVWGGGMYESEDFFELCDELGLLSWQDFLFACAAYPEEEPIRSEVEAEAREQIVRLSAHPSLVLLTGNNENLMGYADWGWQQELDGRTWGAFYYFELFPELVAELAPHVPYTPGSPFSPGGQHPSADEHGSVHLWEQWNRRDWTTYRDHRPRFVAEFGWQGPPAWSTMTRAISDEPLTPESPGMIVHQKAAEGNVKLTRGLLPHFRVPTDTDTWHWAMQLNQANAVRFALDHFRSLAPHNTGAVVWQLNDCWPVTSWAAIDGDERPKPLWHALKHSFAPRVVTIQPREDGLTAVLGNDTAEDWAGEIVVRRLRFDGTVLAEQTESFSASARGGAAIVIASDVSSAQDGASELIVASTTDARGFWFFAEPRDSQLPAADLAVETVAADGGTEVRVTARNLVRDLALQPDKVDPDASTEDGLITLLPGETATLLVRHAQPIDSASLASSRVLRTANELVAGVVR
ncbi:glycoside hydrolase family 2 protein [Microbacterium sp. CIAB417]|uniref:glycoside hydrolase family 2 protein n=1 Tax=Microbacterium sp. CIAB417 TaxID=2860287 RepID=UPI001FAE688D|nr:glycoside hydrolase family 2 protein [Microbacterium sp. CIAB417]